MVWFLFCLLVILSSCIFVFPQSLVAVMIVAVVTVAVMIVVAMIVEAVIVA